MNTPAYLAAIQSDLTAILAAAESAADTIEASPAYNDHLHPFHNAAVSTYNRLVGAILGLSGFKTTE